MATYTTFEREALERYLIMFDIGTLATYEAISDGIENSNYFIRFEGIEQEFVLTITEDLEFDEVPFFNELLQQLVNGGLPVPEPQRTLDGMASTTFKRKPTWLFNRLPGKHPETATIGQCREIGAALARLHELSGLARYSRENVYGPDWAKASLAAVVGGLDEPDQAALERSVERFADFAQDLPRGTIHGDLFRDNALFEGDELTGVIDFYHACDDYLIQDVAITLNDWCCYEGTDDDDKVRALLDGYQSKRALNSDELGAIPLFREFGAMRFALTRLLGGRTDNPIKNPKEFLALLRKLQGNHET